MGREATVFQLESLNYENIRQAIMAPSRKNSVLASERDTNNKVLYTIEFYPEEGKYHYSGHRNCGVTMTPEEQRATKGICPVCTRHVTDGVMRRVQELASEDPRAVAKPNSLGLKWYVDPQKEHPPFVKLVPLNEIIAEAIGSPVASPKVKALFDSLTQEVESELFVLLKAPIEQISKIAGEKVAEGVEKVRTGSIVIQPGYDGVYGVVKIWSENKDVAKDTDEHQGVTEKEKTQLGLEL
jgi:PHP family Zn ribbon phosphoesterase